MKMTDSDKFLLAKTFTELALQHSMIHRCADAETTAMEVTDFFHTVYETLDKDENK